MKRMALLFTVICLMALGSVPAADTQADGSSCTREALKGFIDKYFAALEAHDPSGLPLASDVKYTENGVELPVGNGFWQTAGKTLLRRDLIDTQKCGTHSNVVIEEPFDPEIIGPPAMALPGMKPRELPEKGTPRPIMYGVRLKIENEKISEIEAIIAREHEFAFNVEGQLATKDQDWESILPPADRSSRLAMMAAADDYFDMFAAEPVVHTPFASPCDRWENGLQTTKTGMSTLAGEDGQAAAMKDHDCTPKGLVISNHGPRRFLVDVEAGVVVAFVHFAGGLPDFHVFKMRNGGVELINAVIGAGSPSMGWPDESACKE
ncbi:MAG: hypothetical protein JW896_12235 [Deltaproteobacteria bacterium]|nr:hypothetical protein [Deltaproteobacteria bacterium]